MNHAVALHPWKRSHYLSSEGNQLVIDGVNTLDLVEQYGSPLYVYSENKLRENAYEILSNFRRVHANTRVCFASKACANTAVLKVFKDAGLSIEVNSGGEFFKASAAGYQPEDMVFNGVAKQVSELREVVAAGIRAINVDSLSELQRILEVAIALNRQANVTLRIIPEIKGGASAGWQTGTSASKFGMTREEQMRAIELINEHPASLKMTGVHAHIGTQVNEISAYQAEANFLIDYAKEVSGLLSYPLEHINLGGGYPKNYMSNQDSIAEHLKQQYRTDIDFQVLSEVLIKPITNALGSEIEIIVEPGRSLVSDTAVVLTTIEAEKKRNQSPVFYLDAGYSVLFDIYNGWYFHMLNASRTDDAETKLCRMAGPLCDSSDTYYDIEGEGRVQSLLKAEAALEPYKDVLQQVLIRQPNMRELPANTQVGDVIGILDTGAYALEMMNEYCGRQASAVVMLDLNKNSRLIRRRAHYEDLLTYDVG
jgi:diaminopimelate decarboxylase